MMQANVDVPVSWRLVLSSFSRISLIACLTVLGLSPSLVAQDQSQKWLTRLEITPLASYWGGVHLPVQANFQGDNREVILDAGPSSGLALGMRLQDENAIEVRWSRQDSYASIGGGDGVAPKSDVTLAQLQCNFTHDFAFEHRARLMRPFVLASVGATRIEDVTSSKSLGLTVGIGAGIKLLLTHHVGFRVQAEWLPTFWGQQGTVSCGPDCSARIGGGLVSQMEVAVGPIVRF
jgi:hypothetical protein